jgi:hypothetical protein
LSTSSPRRAKLAERIEGAMANGCMTTSGSAGGMPRIVPEGPALRRA